MEPWVLLKYLRNWPLDSIVHQMNPVRILRHWSLRSTLILSSHLCLGLTSASGFSSVVLFRILIFPFVTFFQLASFDHPNNIWIKVQREKNYQAFVHRTCLTNSTSWEADSRPESQEFSRHLWNPKLKWPFLSWHFRRHLLRNHRWEPKKRCRLNLNSVNQLIFVMVKCGVLFEVRTEFLNNI
jgi:hypothetical protein